ncbi:MAG: carotenoid biosynthesis protein [Bacteroidetes bacterium]|nr:MAG: carotenoid biosynthesis protein [Bacteroidota bacterium]
MNFFTEIQHAAFKWVREVKIFYAVFYVVGVLGLSFPETRPLFIRLVPFALILGFAGVLLFNEAKWNWKTLTAFVVVYISGFVIESIGVNTGLIFGEYIYGETLGYQIFETPLIIGMNWLFLVYVSSSLTGRISSYKFISLLFPPVLMVIYDLVLEQVAPDLGMWSWKNDIIPVQNYIAWFTIAFLFVLVFRFFNVRTTNKIAPLIFVLQFLFFLALYIIKI